MERMRRVNELLKRELGALFERLVCRDLDCLVTVTAVETSPDLRSAHVYVSVYGSPEQQDKVFGLLHKRRKEMQHEISRNVTLKYTPKLDFRIDETAAHADRASCRLLLRSVTAEFSD